MSRLSAFAFAGQRVAPDVGLELGFVVVGALFEEHQFAVRA